MFNFNEFKNEFAKGNINHYAILDRSKQADYKQVANCSMLMNILCSMFEYEKSEEYAHIDDRIIEQTMILNGINGWTYDENNKVVCGFAYDGGIRDNNGIGTVVSVNTLNGKCYDKLTRGISNVVVGLNNATRSADYELLRYADALTEIEISEENNIRFTRINPLYMAKNNKLVKMIRNALSKLKNGEPLIIADNSISLNENTDLIKQASITDTTAIDKLQYLTTYYNAIYRRFFTEYGHALGEGMKQAQQSVAEISSNDSASFTIPLDRLKQREKMCAELEKVFGGTIKVKFSTAWQKEYDRFMKEGASNETDSKLFDNNDNSNN